ncbi:hypothetical protein BGCPKDLD_3130 [Methylorubrum suomiense]|uniref:Uncharacterized protein n=1 Tax=Methylorubrum suomiense TaxID=144191 RepID=A0ABQ4UWL7_9HYPH|nr:hypothetical protein BGCPKDLD_3130 [Methylorubrum suomiense]
MGQAGGVAPGLWAATVTAGPFTKFGSSAMIVVSLSP